MLRHKIAIGLCTALSAGAVGCGSDSGSSPSSDAAGSKVGGTSKTEIPTSAKKGGELTLLAAGDIDWADPGQTYYQFGYQVHFSTSRSLYNYKPDNGTDAVPDLADGAPQVSDDQKTITIKIRKGVKFAPPVNREVTSKDVKYAIERTFTTAVPNGYTSVYFSSIDGAPKEAVKMADLKPFPGLQTPDDHTLVIKLTEPKAALVAGALVLPATAPVPEEFAKKFDAKTPTDYDQYAVASGPYMIENDKSGKLTGRDAGKEIRLVRNPNWDAKTDFRPAFLDSITIEEGNDDANVSNRRTLQGEKLLCCDSGQPPPAILSRALRQNKEQLGIVPSGGTRWVAMNTKLKPFDNLNVRKAVIAAVDRTALQKTRGGAEVGPIAQGFIPPGIPGFKESNGETGFTDEFDWMKKVDGDPALAKKYMLAAKKDGVPVSADGKYTGGKIKLVGDNVDPGLSTATVTQTELGKLGFDIQFTKVPRDTMYTKFCGVPKQQPQLCPTVGWFKDFNDPESMLEPTFDGKAIKPAGNVNWSQLDDPKVNAAMAKAALTSGSERNQAWADINKMIVADAPAIPFIWDNSYQLESKDMNAVMSSYTTTWDRSFTSVK